MSSETVDGIPDDLMFLFNGNGDDTFLTVHLPSFSENVTTSVDPNSLGSQIVPQVQVVSPPHTTQNSLITQNINNSIQNSPVHSNSAYNTKDSSLSNSYMNTTGLRSPSNSNYQPQLNNSDDTLNNPLYINTTGLLSPLSNHSSGFCDTGSYISSSPRSSINGDISMQRSNHGSSDETNKQICIHVQEGAKHKYRHAKEMKIGHGGIKGEITLPTDYKTNDYRIILSVVPSEESKQKIHPCMLHVTVMNQNSKQKRAKYRTQLTSPLDWRVVLDVHQGKVFYIPNYSEINERYEIDCLRNGRIVLGGNNLQLTIISTLQGKKESGGIKLLDVINARMTQEKWNINETAEQIAQSYTSVKANRIDLHRCRLRAQLYKRTFSFNHDMTAKVLHMFVDKDTSSDIIDDRDKNVGSFDLECMSEPNCCCTEGGWKVILISKYGVATVGKEGNRKGCPAVFPVFIFVAADGTISRPEHFWPRFNQINTQSDNLTTHGGAFIFKVPKQEYEVIEQINKSQRKLKLSLYRSLDGIYSGTTFDFDYLPHFAGCPFCIISGGNSYTARKLPDGTNKKRRRMSSTEDFMQYVVGPDHQMDCSADTANGMTDNHPGIDMLDFDLSYDEDCGDPDVAQDNDSIQDNGCSKGLVSTNEDFLLRKNINIIADTVEDSVVDETREQYNDDKSSSDRDASSDENSIDLNSSQGDSSNNSEYEGDIKAEKLKSPEEDAKVPQVKLEQTSVVKTGKTTKDRKSEIENVALNTRQEMANDSSINRVPRKLMVYIISVAISIMFGWIAGYFSLNYDQVFTVALGGMLCGVIVGWYFDDKI